MRRQLYRRIVTPTALPDRPAIFVTDRPPLWLDDVGKRLLAVTRHPDCLATALRRSLSRIVMVNDPATVLSPYRTVRAPHHRRS